MLSAIAIVHQCGSGMLENRNKIGNRIVKPKDQAIACNLSFLNEAISKTVSGAKVD